MHYSRISCEGIAEHDTSKPALRFNVLSQPTENGIDAEGVEPDARKYKCEFCGEKAVFGAQELIFFLEA